MYNFKYIIFSCKKGKCFSFYKHFNYCLWSYMDS